jgi:hypothetical protein
MFEKKTKTRRPWNDRGITVERPSKSVERPKKSMERPKRSVEHPPQKMSFFECVGYGITIRNNMIQIFNLLVHARQCSRPGVMKLDLDHYHGSCSIS